MTPRSRAALVLVLVVLLVWTLVLAWAIGWGLVGLARAVADAPRIATVRVTTANTLKDIPTARAHRDLVVLSRQTDVILAQETSARKAIGVPGFRTRVFPGPGGNRPILWRASRFTLLASGTRLAQWRPFHRAFTFVALRDRQTGVRTTFLNFHGVPHVEVGGHPRRNARVVPYARSQARLGRFLARVHGRVFVGGDWNVSRRPDTQVRWWGFPAVMARRANLTCSADAPSSRPTLGARTVDYVFARRGQGVRLIRLTVGHGYASDHRPVTATYRTRPAGG